MSNDKWREAWIDEDEYIYFIDNEGVEYICGQYFNVAYPDTIHVIEHRAYESKCREVEELQEQIRCLDASLDKKSKEIGRSEHRGNTVDYIYDKCENYGNQLASKCREVEELVKDLEKISQPEKSGMPRVIWNDIAKQALAKHKKGGEGE